MSRAPTLAPRTLVDPAGRALHYLRLSVTERCNFRCVYCLPAGFERPAGERPLSAGEIGRLLAGFASLGFWKVRLTGGEPTLRPDLCELVRRAAATPGIRQVGLSTNGHRLEALAPDLARAGLRSLNVSLDSLDPDRFERITGSHSPERIVAGVEAGLAAGIPSVKVNAVLLPGFLEQELEPFLAWVRRAPVAVRFIELMETAANRALFREERVPAAEARRLLEARGFSELPRREGDGPAVRFGRPGDRGTVGLISASAPDFCGTCNRLRVTSSGDLRLCLFGGATVPLRRLLQDAGDLPALVARVEAAVGAKPSAHGLAEGRAGSLPSLALTGG